MKIKAEKHLNKEAKEIFDRIAEHLRDKGVEQIDSLHLSILAQAFHMHADAVRLGNEHGYTNVFENGTIQINGYQTMMDRAAMLILKYSEKFGLNPVDRAKMIDTLNKKNKKEEPAEFGDL